jgi:hypothetical protein
MYEVSENGQIRLMTGRIIGQWSNDQGYKLVRLSKPRKIERVHRIVAEAFIPNPKCLPFINHIDFDRSNNASVNLEWCTQRENLQHSEKSGRMQRNYWVGKRSPNAILNEETAAGIRLEYAKGGISWAALGAKHGISKRSVGRIVRGESYV